MDRGSGWSRASELPRGRRPSDPLEGEPRRLLEAIESELSVALGDAQHVEACCNDLGGLVGTLPQPTRAEVAREVGLRLAALLGRCHDRMGEVVFGVIERLVRSMDQPQPLLLAVFESVPSALFPRAVTLALELVERGRLFPELDWVQQIGRRIGDRHGPQLDAAGKRRLAAALRLHPRPLVPSAETDPVESLLLGDYPRSVRYLAADLLDLSGEPVPSERIVRGLGAGPAEVLRPYLEFSRASHRDLVDITPADRQPAALAAMIADQERQAGRTLLSTIIAEIGWSRLVYGLRVEHLHGLSLAGSFPVALSPVEATLFARRGLAQPLWERYLATAFGGAEDGDEGARAADAKIQLLRQYNLRHAELLGEILEVGPLTVAKTRRILERMDEVVDDFGVLFGAHSDEAQRLQTIYGALRQQVVDELPQGAALADGQIADAEADVIVNAEVTRRVQMFEDPQNLDEVRTVHGLKRYLHQRGLHHTFRLFRPGHANRTVDLLTVSPHGAPEVLRKIHYVDFEPESVNGRDVPPFAVSLAVEAYGRCLLHGRTELPALEILSYGNEVQIYVLFGNHPLFVRIDLSPPLRGGMIDLEYFGVSQYELANHPDLSMSGLMRFFRALDFHTEIDGLHIHARYDKERAFDMADLEDKVRLLFCLLPYLMDLDWIIGALDYPPPARALVADAWAEFLLRWGVLPTSEVLSADRRHILLERGHAATAEEELVWDGRGPYRDPYSGTPTEDVWHHLREELGARGLGHLARWEESLGRPLGQLTLERGVLGPLREATAIEEVQATSAGLSSTRADRFRREHPVDRFARILFEGGERLLRAAWVAEVARAVEQHFRVRSVGTVHGYPVQVAILPLRGTEVGLFLMRDTEGVTSLAVAAERALLYLRRSASEGSWEQEADLGPSELIEQLRRNNYLPPGFALAVAGAPRETELRARFADPNPRPPAGSGLGERTLFGVAAAPGRAVGFAAFGTARLPSEMSDADVVFAPVIRPEDAPIIRRVAAVVSTGGGILSHAGLIALELQKPALIVNGQWTRQADGTVALQYCRREYQEERALVGQLELVRYTDEQERTEILQEGDLVVVDSGLASLTVLGHDREALSLYQEIRQVDSAAVSLLDQSEPHEVLALRGRLLRSLHRLQRLLERIELPALARFAVHELVLGPSGLGGADEGAQGVQLTHGGPASAQLGLGDAVGAHRVELLRGLFANSAVGSLARDTARAQREELVRRIETLTDEARQTLPRTENLYEVLLLRSRLEEELRSLAQVERLLSECDLEPGRVATAAPAPQRALRSDIDLLCRRQLERFRAALAKELGERVDRPEERWRLRHLLASASALDRLLPEGGIAVFEPQRERLSAEESGRLAELADRVILEPHDGGAELAPRVGTKAAHLGEIASVVGADRVPVWFALSDTAVQRILEEPVDARVLSQHALPEALNLRAATAALLERSEQDIPRAAAAIRQIFTTAAIPPPLRDAILQAYQHLGEAGGAEPLVAIRSSAFEEDTATSAWAGQFDTFLFVRGQEQLFDHLRLALAGLWNERAIRHRRIHGGDPMGAGGGLIIQRMVNPRASGVLLTASLASGRLRQMVINVGLGVGEGVVSGVVDVDQILVSKDTDLDDEPLRFQYRVSDKRERLVFDERSGVGTRRESTLYHQRMRPALEYVDLLELVRAAALLERALGYPVDLEFAFEDAQLNILQVRPIALFESVLRSSIERRVFAADAPVAGAPPGAAAPQKGRNRP